MESKNKLFGHPIHPMLIVLPLGLFISAVIFDIVFAFTGDASLADASFFNISLGILGGLLAAVFGLMEWLAVPAGTRAKRIGAWHGLGNLIVVLMFATSWFFRWQTVGFMPTPLALSFSFGAIVLGVVTAWLGGELVFRLNVGVDHDAGLDATNSLSKQTGTRVGGQAPAAGGHIK